MTEAKKSTKKDKALKRTSEEVEKGIDGNLEKTTTTKDETTKEVVSSETDLIEPKPAAKAGKRSPKAIAKAEEKLEKEARKESGEAPDKEIAKKPPVVARDRIERRGKKFREVAKLIEKGKEYSLKEAVDLAQKTSTTKFDATVELHVGLNVDPKHADQNIRGMVSLPAGTGKTLRVAVFADTEDVKKAKDAGADIAGSDEFLQLLDKEEINFDVLIATPTMMAKLGKYARVLGPKGLMPNPKSGTVTADVVKAVKEAKAGKIEYRVDSAGIVHTGAGKVSFASKDLLENIQAILAGVRSAKPASVKSTYLRSMYLTTSMGPSIKVSLSEF